MTSLEAEARAEKVLRGLVMELHGRADAYHLAGKLDEHRVFCIAANKMVLLLKARDELVDIKKRDRA